MKKKKIKLKMWCLIDEHNRIWSVDERRVDVMADKMELCKKHRIIYKSFWQMKVIPCEITFESYPPHKTN